MCVCQPQWLASESLGYRQARLEQLSLNQQQRLALETTEQRQACLEQLSLKTNLPVVYSYHHLSISPLACYMPDTGLLYIIAMGARSGSPYDVCISLVLYSLCVIKPWRMRMRFTLVGLCVCLCAHQHLTSRASFRPENHITYSTGNEGEKICVDFSETAPLLRYTASCIVWLQEVGHFVCEGKAHALTSEVCQLAVHVRARV